MEKIRVLQISKYYHPFIGGTEQVARDIANALRQYNIQQKIICFNEDSSSDGVISHRKETVSEQVDGVEVIRCGCFAKVASQGLSMTFGRELDRLMNEFKPNVVILHYPNPFATHYLLKYRNRDFRLYVYWHLDITKQKHLKRLFVRQNITLISRATKILGATPFHLNNSEFSNQFGSKKYLLPYAIDERNLMITDEEVKEAESICGRYEGKTICFFIGRHVPYKGIEYLIDSSALIQDNHIVFIIAGSGELTESLEKKAQNDKKVVFIGQITNSQKRAYMYACDIFCFPSITRNEGFGLALAEGMYYGKPAVTYHIDGSGVNYVNLNGVTGIECPNRDVQAYANAIERLSDDRELRIQMGKAAHQRVIDNFTQQKFASNLYQLITNNE